MVINLHWNGALMKHNPLWLYVFIFAGAKGGNVVVLKSRLKSKAVIKAK